MGWEKSHACSASSGAKRPAPTTASRLVSDRESAVVYPRARETAFSATWVGHSTVLLQVGGLNILTDPVFSQRAFPVQWAGPRRVMDPGLPLEHLPPIDIVLQSHNHYDHLDRPAVRRIAATQPGVSWIVPLGVGSYVRRWGAKEIVELDWWQDLRSRGSRHRDAGSPLQRAHSARP
jgi:L-ascorbate metabolism protein UlaG (beta-lactamase superfamily)